MSNNNIEKQAKQVLDKRVDALDSNTLQRLRVARENALARKKSSPFSLKWLGKAGAGIALASVLTMFLVPNLLETKNLSPFEDLELLTAETELEVITHLEFYEWLGDNLDES